MVKYCKFRQKYYNYSYNGVLAALATDKLITSDFIPNGSVISKL